MATAIAFALGVAPAHASTASFSFTGAEQVFSVPAGVTSVGVTAVGAAGANSEFTGHGGRGAVVSGTVAVAPGQTLYVEVGGAGPGAGFNGGGNPFGGGASDVRALPGIAGQLSLLSRLIVAGGGGGGSGSPGGDAGSPGSGLDPGGPGTATSGGVGGTGGSCDGGDGALATGGDGCASMNVGGGGGGLFGGGGGSDFGGGGGGGSSLVPSGGTLTLPPSAEPPGVAITYTIPPPADVALFTGSPKSLRVSKTGRFTYKFLATPGRSGKAKLTSTKKLKIGSKKRKLKVPAKSFTAPSNGEVKLKFKLSSENLKALKRKTSLKFKVAVTVGSQSFTANLKLTPPKKS